MRLRAIGCLVVAVLIIGMYIVLAYGDDLGIVHPINRTATHQTIDANLTNSPFNGTLVTQAYDRLQSGEVIVTNLTGGQ
jgi:hypothetical protein